MRWQHKDWAGESKRFSRINFMWRVTPTRREYYRQKLLADYEQAKMMGQCTSLGCKRPAADGITSCRYHALRYRLYPLKLSLEEQTRAIAAFEIFDGICQCCGSRDPGIRGWCLDHCHETHTFRGIICNYCNAMLGMARDSVKTLLDGVLYLESRRKP